MCLAGAVVASWFLRQEVAGSQVQALFTVMTNILVTEFTKLSETFRKNSNEFKEVEQTSFRSEVSVEATFSHYYYISKVV